MGVTTQIPDLEKQFEPESGARRLKNYLKTLNMELTALTRACCKSNVHHLEREDLVTLTVEAAAIGYDRTCRHNLDSEEIKFVNVVWFVS